MDALTVSSKVVRGKPVAMWRRVRDSPGMVLWAFASPPALILAAIKLVFFYSRLSFGATVLYVFMAIGAFGGLFILGLVRDARPIECDCPVCGARVWFEFTRRSIEPELPIACCRKCLVYVARRDDQISEAALETLSERQGFWVDTDQYEANVRRRDGGGIAFDLPAFCAVCGSGDAPHEREIEIHFADGVNEELWRQLSYYRTGSRGHAFGTISASSAPSGISGRDFLNFRVPVCAQHQDPTTRPTPMRTDDYGSLWFASYRFYKAFVVANHIMPSGTEALPEARVRS